MTDHACQEIRLNRMTRDEALTLVRQYSPVSMQYIKQFLEWSSLSMDEFEGLLNKHKKTDVAINAKSDGITEQPKEKFIVNGEHETVPLLNSFYKYYICLFIKQQLKV